MRDVTIPLNALTAFIAFLLTHPVWDVTMQFSCISETFRFLLTHPVWDVTYTPWSNNNQCDISTHTSRVGCDSAACSCVNPSKFLLTHPVWDVTAIYSILQSQHPHISRDGLIIHLELY